MAITFTATKDAPADVDAFIVPILSTPDGPYVPPAAVGAEYLDAAHLTTSGITGKPNNTHSVPGPNGTTIIGVGIGNEADVTTDVVRSAFAVAARAARRFGKVAAWVGQPTAVDMKAMGQAIAEGVILGTYKFTRLKKAGEADALSEVFVLTTAKAKMQQGLDRGAVVARFQCNARDWVNEPAGELTPTDLAAAVKQLAAESPALKLTVWDEKQIEKERLGALRGVSLGSDQPPRLIRLEYNPPGARKTLFFVGKGITFDSGGLSLKTAQGMETMKTDMGGAAAVLNATAACAALGVKTRVVALACCTENMPGPKAIKPGDVLRARNGVTMEVLNTDAEGRLVLSDGLSLAAEEKPNAIVDVATLTGAQVVALGSRIAAVLGNNETLVQKVKDAAANAGELVWEMPLPAIYRKHIDSDIADIKNIGAPGQAGTIAAALFLQEFVDGVPWAHLDIAGPARAAEQDGEIVKGGTGFSVRTLVELASTYR
ncbi:MAG TPA: leucyl aminopeptidase, partial [Acidimicrobiales bacterium]|nr:leucyl aminopeptidase [Acidimicrobiales bacterium]